MRTVFLIGIGTLAVASVAAAPAADASPHSGSRTTVAAGVYLGFGYRCRPVRRVCTPRPVRRVVVRRVCATPVATSPAYYVPAYVPRSYVYRPYPYPYPRAYIGFGHRHVHRGHTHHGGHRAIGRRR